MQTTLIQRYLGNKSLISKEIIDIIRGVASPGDLIFDAFSGSLAVSAALRTAGFEVACNDVNYFSWLFARAYFSSSTLPDPPSINAIDENLRKQYWEKELAQLVAEDMSDVPKRWQRNDIFNHYCEEGENSRFLSKRGTVGRRRFFSSTNARSIDRALGRIRYRHRSGQIDEQARCILTSVLISAVEKISNTQGTYHDFPREFVDRRALKHISLNMPAPEIFSGPVSRYIGKAEDSLQFACTLPPHKVIYLDPPYNFRQYTSYYFMLNLLSKYPEIVDLDDYFQNIEFVRGQNMKDNFKSTFCNRNAFIASLEKLVRRSKSEYVVLSYFDGRNHWGEFKAEKAETEGKQFLEKFFQSDLFEQGSFEFVPIERTNYQSYGGYSAKTVREFLFVARKSSAKDRSANKPGREKWTGQRLALQTA